jgi:hypothetical protein
MIHVDRSPQPPAIIDTKDPNSPGMKELNRAREYFIQDLEKRRQQQFNFKIYHDSTISEALAELFQGKCAYCESYIEPIYPGITTHYRPKSGVTGEKGEYYADGYWWLANEWTNLLYACMDCGRGQSLETPVQMAIKGGSLRGNRFPLEDEAQRATEPGQEEFEKPLLLNPCDENPDNDPEKHLVFTVNGMVVSETSLGKTSISVLNLNRPDLVEARELTASRVLSDIETLEVYSNQPISSDPDQEGMLNDLLEQLKRHTEPDQEYAALKRQLVNAALDRILSPMPEEVKIKKEWEPTRKIVSEDKKKKAKESYGEYQQSMQDYSLEEMGGEEKYFSQQRRIEMIEIHNLKALAHLELDLTQSQSGLTPWMVLLGNNATGKSTVLHSVALALAGQKYFKTLVSTLGLNPSDFRRIGSQNSYVKVYMSGFSYPFKLTFLENSVEFEGSDGEISRVTFEHSADGNIIFNSDNLATLEPSDEGWRAKILMLGYGPTRLLPRRQMQTAYGEPYARVENLFDPYTPLVDTTQWLINLYNDPKTRDRYDYAVRRLKMILGLDEKSTIYPDNGRILIPLYDEDIPLENLSDGYQSVVALTTDILSIVLRPDFTYSWKTPEDAEGIVLLDEIGSHLHPVWKMRVVSNLREFMPGIQFIATTHEPLCLRGLNDGEITVLQRNAKNDVVAVTDLPSVEGLRVDQLLTSEHFGLLSTRSLKTEVLFTEYYDLLAKRELTPDEEKQLVDYEARLEDLREMGVTRRERMMLKAIDRYLASEPEFLGTPEEDQRKSTLNKELDNIASGFEEEE